MSPGDPGSDPSARLAELVAEVRRQRDAVREYRLSAYPEKRALHELKLLSLYVEIRKHCQKHDLPLPPEVPPRTE